MSGQISDQLAQRWLQVLIDTPCWVGLMTADPATVADPLTVEVPGLVYRRPQVLWTLQPRVLVNTNPLPWTGLAFNTHLAAVAGFDQPFNGTMLFSHVLEVPRSFPSGGSWTLPAGELFVGIDV